MESLEEELSGSLNYTGNARWMIPYADLLTVVMGMLLVLLALAHLDHRSLQQYTATIQKQLNAQTQNESTDISASEANSTAALMQQLKAVQPTMAAEQPASNAGDPSQVLVDTSAGEGVLPGAAKGIEVIQEARGLVITMPDQVLFSPGSAALDGNAKHTLDQLAEILRQTDAPIRVEGHTDNSPIATTAYPSNWELSTQRATGIVRYFIQAHGFDPAQLSAAGYGEFKPVASNSSIQGKQKNRRVDIVVLNHQAQQQEPQ